MKLFVKSMVCNRCIMVVKNELERIGIKPRHVQLGIVHFDRDLTDAEKQLASETLDSLGFEIIDDKKSRLIVQIKTLVIELVHYKDNDLKTNLSDYLSRHLNHDYNYISNLFSEVEGKTIEKYFIAQKIERVKELIVYDELSLSEIAFRMNYSSVAYLSNQFKKVTGLTPSHFKNIKTIKRKPLDQV